MRLLRLIMVTEITDQMVIRAKIKVREAIMAVTTVPAIIPLDQIEKIFSGNVMQTAGGSRMRQAGTL